jgi:multidrug efflux pump
MVEEMKKQPELRDVASDQQVLGLQTRLVYDRDTISRLGLTPSIVDQTLYDAYGQRQISTIFTQLNQYHVVMEVLPGFQTGPLDLQALYVRSGTSNGTTGLVAGGGTTSGSLGPTSSSALASSTGIASASLGGSTTSASAQVFGGKGIASTTVFPNGSQVPLSAFTQVATTTVPITVNHQGQFPVVTLSFNLAPGASLGDAVTAMSKVKETVGLPASVQAEFQGSAAAFENSLANEPILILAAIVTVYIVLGVLYESYIHPITILSTLPSAGVGALLALYLCRTDFSIIALIGIVLLIGIVKKNAIMMIDFALEAERKEGKSPLDAIYQASLLRFRPIMMTTMAALLGGVPLALGTGVGSELRRPLGITIVGGLILSQILTLYTTPVIYLFFDRLAVRFSGRRSSQSFNPEAVPAD